MKPNNTLTPKKKPHPAFGCIIVTEDIVVN